MITASFPYLVGEWLPYVSRPGVPNFGNIQYRAQKNCLGDCLYCQLILISKQLNRKIQLCPRSYMVQKLNNPIEILSIYTNFNKASNIIEML